MKELLEVWAPVLHISEELVYTKLLLASSLFLYSLTWPHALSILGICWNGFFLDGGDMISLWVSYLSIYSWRFPYDHLFWIGDGSHCSHVGGLVVEWGKILEELGMPFLDSFVGDDFLLRFLERGREDLSQSFFSSRWEEEGISKFFYEIYKDLKKLLGVFGETKVASDNVSKESLVILFVLDEVIDHMIKDSANLRG